MGKEPDQLASDIQRRANALNISIAKLCRDVGASRRWFEYFKKRVPKSIEIYIKIDERLKVLERESRFLAKVEFTCPRSNKQREGVIKNHNGIQYIFCPDTYDSYSIKAVTDLQYILPK